VVSLIWTKLKLPAAASDADASVMRRDESTPPVATQTSQSDPGHAVEKSATIDPIHVSSVGAGRDAIDDHRGPHVGVKGAEVLIVAGRGEGLPQRLFVAEPAEVNAPGAEVTVCDSSS